MIGMSYQSDSFVLEIRRSGNTTEGSNPSSSAKHLSKTRLRARFSFLPTNLPAIIFGLGLR